MRFLDELRGAEGERCTVADLRNGLINPGTVEEVREGSGKVRVRYDDGTLVSVGYCFVHLEGEETP